MSVKHMGDFECKNHMGLVLWSLPPIAFVLCFLNFGPSSCSLWWWYEFPPVSSLVFSTVTACGCLHLKQDLFFFGTESIKAMEWGVALFSVVVWNDCWSKRWLSASKIDATSVIIYNPSKSARIYNPNLDYFYVFPHLTCIRITQPMKQHYK